MLFKPQIDNLKEFFHSDQWQESGHLLGLWEHCCCCICMCLKRKNRIRSNLIRGMAVNKVEKHFFSTSYFKTSYSTVVKLLSSEDMYSEVMEALTARTISKKIWYTYILK